MSKIVVHFYGPDDFKPGDAVLYIPCHAEGNPLHADVEPGVVSAVNDKFVFVKYLPRVLRGWNGAPAKATNAFDLVKIVDLELQEG